MEARSAGGADLGRPRDRPARPRGRWRAVALLVALGGLVGGCLSGPETVVPAIEIALSEGDDDALAAALTASSRPLVGALRALAGGRVDHPMRPRPSRRPTVLQHAQVQLDGSAVVRVSDGERVAEWIVRYEGGRWRLDLLASSSRRAFIGL